LLRHEHASLALAQRCSAVPAPLPLFSTLLNYRYTDTSKPDERRRTAWDGITLHHREERSNFPLAVSINDLGADLTVVVQAAGGIDSRRVCDFMQTALAAIERTLALLPDTPVSRLDVLPEIERRQLLTDWNASGLDVPRDRCVHQLFEAQARRTPDAVAVVSEAGALSYAALDERASQLARRLRQQGVGSEARVALLMERGLEMVIALLGVLKAGGAYVPIDPTNPSERVRFMLRDSAPMVVLMQRRLLEGLDVGPVAVLDLEDGEWQAPIPEGDRAPAVAAQQLAYMIYTSGSTGVPKGTMNAHAAVVNLLGWLQHTCPLTAADAVLQRTPCSFDASVPEIFWSLTAGARLVLARPHDAKDPAYLCDTIRRHQITIAQLVPALFQLLVEQPTLERCRSLRYLQCGGDVLPSPVVARCRARLPQLRIDNVYGPTETAVDVMAWTCSPDSPADRRIPVGRPVANSTAYVLDSAGAPAPIGVTGEIYIGGAQVGRGYLRQPALTAARFVADPFSQTPGARLYRTGDLGRWRADRTLEILGRNDFQVKLRGFRIELGEVEARLSSHPAVRDVVVVARAAADGEVRLVAYYSCVPGDDPVDAASLRAYAATTLPEYMVPNAFVHLPALPLTAHGKVDRDALPALRDDPPRSAYRAPRNASEWRVCTLFEQVLQVERVGIDDNFFELGGHSLTAMKLATVISRELGAEFSLRRLFETPTVAGLVETVLAPSVGDVRVDPFAPVLPIRSAGSLPPLFCIHAVGGLSWAYTGLLKHITSDRPVYGLQDPGITQPDLLAQPMAEVAAGYADRIRAIQPAGPYHLVGWSYGGQIAFLIANLLRAQGAFVSLLALIDSAPPALQRAAPTDAVFVKPDLSPVKQMALAIGGSPEITAALDAVWERNASLSETFAPSPYSGDVLFFLSRGAPDQPLRRMDGWRALIAGDLRVVEVAAAHQNLLIDRAATAVIGRALAEALEASLIPPPLV
jgi:arthrofactin-type cyclic lipopeptide synthetase A/arthrofactin-type cyclic lipopeptide synthetase B